MPTGIIKQITDKGFGFIAAETGDDVFFHASALIDVSFDELQEGWKVQFEVEEGPKGPRAIHVRVTVRDAAAVAIGHIRNLTDQGFGFIGSEKGDVVFFHASALIDVGFDELQEGRQVQFDVEEGPKGLRAIILRVAGEIRVLTEEQKKEASTRLANYKKRVTELGREEKSVSQKREELKRDYSDTPQVFAQINQITESAERTYNYNKNRRDRLKNDLPISSVRRSDMDHRIQSLQPSSEWQLLVDETGASFSRSHSGDRLDPGRPGKVVGVLLPDYSSITPLPPKTHFVDLKIEERDRIIQQLLDVSVGVFGVTVDNLPNTPGDRWVDGVLYVVKWVLRLLPINGDTEFNVLIEQRGVHAADKSNWDALLREVLQNLTEKHPERYSRVNASIKVVKKEESEFLAYADAVAHTWGSTAPDAMARLRQSGLKGTCLHAGDGGELMRAWDLLKTGTQLDGDAWRQLLHNPDSNESLGIAGILLNQVRQACEQSPDLWQRYFEATQQYLESKAIQLTQLGKEVQWLASCKPVDAEIPLRLELAWRTAELEASNHNGCIDEAIVSKLETLGEKLFDEDPALVCQADLVRAVLATNQFQFDQATRALDRWQNTQMAVAGRQHWGRVQSSLGQHAAFHGNFDQAEDYFAQAINAFDALTDKQVAAAEKRHTATYRAIVAIDHPDNDPATVRRHVGEVVSIALDDIRSIAASTEQKYAHHLLLRYLVRHGISEERAAYLAARDCWRSNAGHPWPLIAAYRGMLLYSTDPAEAILQMREGVALCEGQGPTVGLIGLTLGVIAMGWGAEDDVVDEQDLEAMETLLPAAGDRIADLRQALKTPLDPPESLLAQVLPFNFR